jgi:hypothetical protein
MSANKTPLEMVNEAHGDKAKLVDSLLGILEPSDAEEPKDDLKARLLAASNRKLLRLLKVSRTVKDKYGSKDKLVAAVAAAYGRAKDGDYVGRLSRYTSAKLLDIAESLARRARPAPTGEAAPASGGEAEAAPAKKPARPRAAAKPKAERAAAARKGAKATKAQKASKPAKASKPTKAAAKKPAKKKKK